MQESLEILAMTLVLIKYVFTQSRVRESGDPEPMLGYQSIFASHLLRALDAWYMGLKGVRMSSVVDEALFSTAVFVCGFDPLYGFAWRLRHVGYRCVVMLVAINEDMQGCSGC